MHSPPPPPSMRRKLRIPAAQAVALSVVAALPVAAAAGAFHDTQTRTASNDQWSLSVSYPRRLMLQETDSIAIELTSKLGCRSAVLVLDHRYFEQFEDVMFTPPADESYVVRLGELSAGTKHRVSIELIAAEEFSIPGWARVQCEDSAVSTEVHFSTFVFP